MDPILKYAMLVVFAAVMFSTAPSVPAHAADYGLVIVESSYADMNLPEAVEEGRLMEKALTQDGFQVVFKQNLGRRELVDLIQSFEERPTPADRVCIFYSGVGFSYEDVNYLLPTSALIRSGADIEFEAMPLDRLCAGLSAKGVALAVFIDGNRRHPVLSIDKVSPGFSLTGGLPNTLMLYAGGVGESRAIDGQVGVFARTLATMLRVPGLELNQIINSVRKASLASSRLVPVATNALLGDWYFLPGPNSVALAKGTFSFSVRTTLEGLQVFVDGVRAGVAPLELELSAGSHHILYRHPLKESLEEDVIGIPSQSIVSTPQLLPNRNFRISELLVEKQDLILKRSAFISSHLLVSGAKEVSMDTFWGGLATGAALVAWTGIIWNVETNGNPSDPNYPMRGVTSGDMAVAAGISLGIGAVAGLGYLLFAPKASTKAYDERLAAIDAEIAELEKTR